jgi:adenine-specific DNA-methyltransferase
MGLSFMAYLSLDKISDLGAVYTPDGLANYVSEVLINFLTKKLENQARKLYKINNQDNKAKRKLFVIKELYKQSVIDPACGDASLLVAFERALNKIINIRFNEYKKITNDKLQFFNEQPVTFGFDIDYDAVISASDKLSGYLTDFPRKSKIVQADCILPVDGKPHYEGWKVLLDRVSSFNSFSALIANPPWGASLNYSREYLRENGYTLAQGQFDIYDLFIELSLKLVEKNGILAFILPDSIFLPEHQRLRKLLLENTQIKMISRLGEGFFPKVYRACVVMILENAKPTKKTITTCVRLNKSIRDAILNESVDLADAEKLLGHPVKQSRFYNDLEYRFDIDVKVDEENLLNKIENNPIDWNELTTGRGVEISKKGLIIVCSECNYARPKPRKKVDTAYCNNCGHLINLKEQQINSHIVSKVYNKDWIQFVVGEDVKRYSIEPKHYIKPSVLGINYKQNENIQLPKIVIRKTGVGINATLDNTGYLTSQTVFHFSIEGSCKDVFSHEYLLGVLNSRVMLYYYLKKYGDNEWKSHAYITQKIIKQLPIPKIDENNIKQAQAIHNAVKKIIDLNKYSFGLDFEIERLVAGLYDLDEYETTVVNQTIKSAQQLKAISTLTLPEEITISPKKVY